MENPMEMIAWCILIWTICIGLVALIMCFVGLRIFMAIGHFRRMADDLKRDVMPIIYQGRGLADDFKKIGKDVRKQVKKSEVVVQDTIRNVNDTTTRVKDAVTGLALILGTIGRLLSPMAPKKNVAKD